jgi:parallel beta-helix repeat protein
MCAVILAFSLAPVVWAAAVQTEIGAGPSEVLIRVPSTTDFTKRHGGGGLLSARTIAEALQLASIAGKAGGMVRILIAPGTYHESCAISGSNTGPLILEASTPGSVVITGADDWNDWLPVKGMPLIAHTWPDQLAPSTLPKGWESQALQPIVLRREMVFEGDRPLEQVLSLDAALSHSGSFFADDYNFQLYVHPISILSVPQSLGVARRSFLLAVENSSHLTIRGITFAGAASAVEQGAVEVSSSGGITFEQCRFSENNWTGLVLSNSRNVSIRHCSSEDNGGPGITIWKVKGLEVSDVEVRGNNWRGAAGGFTGWAIAGLKALRLHDARFDHFRAIGNLTRGLWLDTDCANVQLTFCTMSRNLTDGLFLEVSQGPIGVEQSTICENGKDGVLGSDSAHIQLERSRVFGNGQAQIAVSGQPGTPRSVQDWETNVTYVLRDESWSLSRNVIATSNSAQVLLNSSVDLTVWQGFVATLSSDYNFWLASPMTNPFIGANGIRYSFETWRESSGQDIHSKMLEARGGNTQSSEWNCGGNNNPQ